MKYLKSTKIFEAGVLRRLTSWSMLILSLILIFGADAGYSDFDIDGLPATEEITPTPTYKSISALAPGAYTYQDMADLAKINGLEDATPSAAHAFVLRASDGANCFPIPFMWESPQDAEKSNDQDGETKGFDIKRSMCIFGLKPATATDDIATGFVKGTSPYYNIFGNSNPESATTAASYVVDATEIVSPNTDGGQSGFVWIVDYDHPPDTSAISNDSQGYSLSNEEPTPSPTPTPPIFNNSKDLEWEEYWNPGNPTKTPVPTENRDYVESGYGIFDGNPGLLAKAGLIGAKTGKSGICKSGIYRWNAVCFDPGIGPATEEGVWQTGPSEFIIDAEAPSVQAFEIVDTTSNDVISWASDDATRKRERAFKTGETRYLAWNSRKVRDVSVEILDDIDVDEAGTFEQSKSEAENLASDLFLKDQDSDELWTNVERKVGESDFLILNCPKLDKATDTLSGLYTLPIVAEDAAVWLKTTEKNTQTVSTSPENTEEEEKDPVKSYEVSVGFDGNIASVTTYQFVVDNEAPVAEPFEAVSPIKDLGRAVVAGESKDGKKNMICFTLKLEDKELGPQTEKVAGAGVDLLGVSINTEGIVSETAESATVNTKAYNNISNLETTYEFEWNVPIGSAQKKVDEGKYELTASFRDGVINEDTATVDFYVDNSPPVKNEFTVKIKESPWNSERDIVGGSEAEHKTAKITLTVTDLPITDGSESVDGSGVSLNLIKVDASALNSTAEELTINDATPQRPDSETDFQSSYTISWEVEVTSDTSGIKNVTAAYADAVGNNASSTNTIYVDNTPPVASISVVNSETGNWADEIVGGEHRVALITVKATDPQVEKGKSAGIDLDSIMVNIEELNIVDSDSNRVEFLTIADNYFSVDKPENFKDNYDNLQWNVEVVGNDSGLKTVSVTECKDAVGNGIANQPSDTVYLEAEPPRIREFTLTNSESCANGIVGGASSPKNKLKLRLAFDDLASAEFTNTATKTIKVDISNLNPDLSELSIESSTEVSNRLEWDFNVTSATASEVTSVTVDIADNIGNDTSETTSVYVDVKEPTDSIELSPDMVGGILASQQGKTVTVKVTVRDDQKVDPSSVIVDVSELNSIDTIDISSYAPKSVTPELTSCTDEYEIIWEVPIDQPGEGTKTARLIQVQDQVGNYMDIQEVTPEDSIEVDSTQPSVRSFNWENYDSTTSHMIGGPSAELRFARVTLEVEDALGGIDLDSIIVNAGELVSTERANLGENLLTAKNAESITPNSDFSKHCSFEWKVEVSNPNTGILKRVFLQQVTDRFGTPIQDPFLQYNLYPQVDYEKPLGNMVAKFDKPNKKSVLVMFMDVRDHAPGVTSFSGVDTTSYSLDASQLNSNLDDVRDDSPYLIYKSPDGSLAPSHSIYWRIPVTENISDISPEIKVSVLDRVGNLAVFEGKVNEYSSASIRFIELISKAQRWYMLEEVEPVGAPTVKDVSQDVIDNREMLNVIRNW